MNEVELKMCVNQAMTALKLACDLLQSTKCNIEITNDLDIAFLVNKSENNLISYFLFKADEEINLNSK
jgi:hypothetical protein